MRYIFLIFLFFIVNCSLEKNYKSEKKTYDGSEDVILMSSDDYKNYIDHLTKKNKYPDINN
tara:strand:+ start:167 stop:349 length:183 start_codon:yes stop_codon:yes gene_type:complete